MSQKNADNTVNTEPYVSRIVMSRSVMSPVSVYVNETKSFALGLELLQNYLGSVRCILPKNIQIYCVGDNQPSTVVLSE